MEEMDTFWQIMFTFQIQWLNNQIHCKEEDFTLIHLETHIL